MSEKLHKQKSCSTLDYFLQHGTEIAQFYVRSQKQLFLALSKKSGFVVQNYQVTNGIKNALKYHQFSHVGRENTRIITNLYCICLDCLDDHIFVFVFCFLYHHKQNNTNLINCMCSPHVKIGTCYLHFIQCYLLHLKIPDGTYYLD